jgi:pimeloyl-ACP methyl ester carboxylesterase
MNLFRSDKAERVLAENGCARLLRMTIDAWAANGGVDSAVDRRAYVAAWMLPGALTGALNYYRASPLYPREEAEAAGPLELDPAAFRVQVPTLVIWGERDEALLPGNLDGLEQHVEPLQVVRIPEGSHWVVHEQPERVAGLIRTFLA